jgi:hypothetical protein
MGRSRYKIYEPKIFGNLGSHMRYHQGWMGTREIKKKMNRAEKLKLIESFEV